MKDPRAYLTDGHPSEEELFLWIESELGRRHSARIRKHVAACWRCRAQIERQVEVINDYVRYQDFVLGPGAPPPPGNWLRFAGRLRQAVRERREASQMRGRMFSLLAQGRALWPKLLGVAAVLAWILFVGRTPTVSAQEALDDAARLEKAALDRVSQPVVHQRIRLRSGTAEAEGEIWRAPRFERYRGRWSGEQQMVERLASAFRASRLDFQDPLSARTFVRWRNSLAAKTERVTQDGGEYLRISTAPEPWAAHGPILEANLTLRKTDWHTVAQTLRVRSSSGEVADYEMREISFEVLLFDRVRASVFHESVPAHKPAEPVARVIPRAAPPQPDLDDVEARLREAFHEVGADVREAPEIGRLGQDVYYRLWTDSPQRNDEISRATASIPHLRRAENREPLPPAPDHPAPARTFTAPYATTPPLEKDLQDYAGGPEAANRYLDAVRDAFLRTLSEASALSRLAGRYDSARLARLSPEARGRIAAISADHLHAIASGVEEYQRLIAPVLEEMMRRAGVPALPGSESDPAACGPARAVSESLVDDLRGLQKAHSRLFIRDQVEQPEDQPAHALLEEAARRRSRLREDLRQLCPLE